MSRLVAAGSGLAVAGFAHALANARLLRRPPDPAPPPQTSVAILVPARNEAADIAGCVRSLLGQGEAIVLDDESTDGTGAAARTAGARVLAGAPPPPGWLGKPWACAQLAAATDADVLVFVDADVRLAPGAVAAAVAALDEFGLDVVCPFPRQRADTAAERLVQPLLQWSWLTTLPLRVAERSPRPSLTAACGQFLVIRRSALDRAGGHAAIRDQVLDDLALVRAVKAGGGRGGVVDGIVARHLPDVRRLAGAARRVREVAVGRIRVTGPGHGRPGDPRCDVRPATARGGARFARRCGRVPSRGGIPGGRGAADRWAGMAGRVRSPGLGRSSSAT